MFNELTDHGFDSVSQERMLATLNAAYYDVCSREAWPFLQTRLRLTFTGSSYEPSNAPTDIRAVTAMKVEAGGSRLRRVRDDIFEEAYGDNTILTGGGAKLFTIDGQNALHFYPAPAASDVIRCTYIRRPPPLAADTLEASILLPLEFQRACIVNGALFRLYAMEDDIDIAPTFEGFYERAISTMREQLWKNDYSTPDIIHPVDPEEVGIEMFGTTFGGG